MPETMAIIIGAICGALAGIPTAALLLLIWPKRRERPALPARGDRAILSQGHKPIYKLRGDDKRGAALGYDL